MQRLCNKTIHRIQTIRPQPSRARSTANVGERDATLSTFHFSQFAVQETLHVQWPTPKIEIAPIVVRNDGGDFFVPSLESFQ